MFCKGGIVFLISVVVFSINTSLVSQPFSTLEFGISYNNVQLLDESYRDLWSVNNSTYFTVRMPYYLGRIGANIDFFDYSSIDGSDSFESINYSAGFFFRSKRFSTIFLETALTTGIQTLTVKKGANDFFNESERELFYSIKLEPSIPIQNVVLVANFEFRKIYNYQRQNLFIYGFGLRYKVTTPTRVAELIK